jgi:hypothetical protein
MFVSIVSLCTTVLFLATDPTDGTVIRGFVVNGSRDGAPAVGAKVVLLAGRDNQLVRIADTTTDEKGTFIFDRLPATASPDVEYVVGAQWEGVHYSGPRFRIASDRGPTTVKITVHDAVTSPSPLIAEFHEIDIQIDNGTMKVTEIISVYNPGSKTYVGTADSESTEKGPTTLSLSIPDGVSHVTFNKEYDARNFEFRDGRMATSVPWPPGKRQLAFVYRLPVESHAFRFQRALDLPCRQARVAVAGLGSEELTCNLPGLPAKDGGPIGFVSNGDILPAGHVLQLQMKSSSTLGTDDTRWLALAILGGLVSLTILFILYRRRAATPRSARSTIAVASPATRRPTKPTAAS